MKRLGGVLLSITCVVVLAGCTSKSNEPTVASPAIAELASCLTTNGATFYGTNWCPHCQAQKAMFGDAVSSVNFVDCDANAAICQGAGVTGYPTWVFADGSKLVGTQQLADLATKAGCTFAPEALVADQMAAALTR